MSVNKLESHFHAHTYGDDISQITDTENYNEIDKTQGHSSFEDTQYVKDDKLVEKLRENIRSIFTTAINKSEQSLNECYHRLDNELKVLEDLVVEGFDLMEAVETDKVLLSKHKQELEKLVSALR